MRTVQSFQKAKPPIHSFKQRTALEAAVRCGMESLESRRLLTAGQLDPTFGNGGVVRDVSLPVASDVVVQPDGKVVEAAQFFGHISVARFNADGSPDKSFGYFGRLTSDVGGVTKVADIALQSDGKIVVAGTVNGNSVNDDFLVTRYNANGSLDTTFNRTGMVTTDFGFNDEASALAVAANGQIVVVGNAVGSVGPTPTNLALARYNPDGTLDATFGNHGEVLNAAGGRLSYDIHDVAVSTDNKVVVVGVVVGQSGGFFLVQRFNANGVADSTNFAAPPHVARPPGEYNAVAIQSDGKIVAAGDAQAATNSGDVNAVLVRYNTDGTLDTAFGNGGEVDPANGPSLLPAAFSDMVLQPDGKIVAGGRFRSPGLQNSYLSRYRTDGTPDPTFTSVTDGTGVIEQFVAIAEGPGNTIVASGVGGTQLSLFRYSGDGVIVVSGAAIGGTVYNDANGNGLRDPGEAPIAGRQVYLDLNGIGVFATGDPISTTDANGAYAFTNLNPKNYLVRLVPQSGLVISMPLYGGKYFVQLGQNQVVTGDDFGTQAIGAPNFPLPGGQLLVAGSAPMGLFTLTRYNADGSTDVAFGKLGVVTLPGGVGASPINSLGQPNGQIVVTYAADIVTLSPIGAIVSIVPTVAVGGSIGGTVYDDANVNGVRDPGEAGVAGRQVYLDLNGIGVFAGGDPITTTDANGTYSFGNLPAANYLVRLVPQAGKVITAPLFGGKFFVILGKNQAVTGDDFGTETVTGVTTTQPDGKLLVGGVYTKNQTPFGSVSRFNVDGSTDTTFGGHPFFAGSSPPGTAVIDSVGINGHVTQFFIRPDGSILLAVYTSSAGSSHNVSTSGTLELLSQSGQLGNLGPLIVSVSNGTNDQLSLDRVALTPDNKILAAGTQKLFGGFGPATLQVRRFNFDRTLDLTFGGTGIVTIAGYGEPDSVAGLADGRVVLTFGQTTLRLTSTGAIDTSPVPAT